MFINAFVQSKWLHQDLFPIPFPRLIIKMGLVLEKLHYMCSFFCYVCLIYKYYTWGNACDPMHLLLILKTSPAVTPRTTLKILIALRHVSPQMHVPSFTHGTGYTPRADGYPSEHARTHVSATTHQLLEQSRLVVCTWTAWKTWGQTKWMTYAKIIIQVFVLIT